MALQPHPQTLVSKTFDELQGDFCKDEVLVRLINFWEARNVKAGNILIGFGLLLIDTKSTTMQGFIPVSRLFRYEDNLKANAVYKLKKFEIGDSKPVYRVSDHKYALTFTNQTVFERVAEGAHPIDVQQFRLRKFNDFAAIVDQHTELFDLIGRLTVVTGNNIKGGTSMCAIPQTKDSRAKDRVFLHLLMEDGETMRVFLWDKIAEEFCTRWNANQTKPTVLLLTTVNPKFFGGAVTVNSMSSSRLFFDDDIVETVEFLKRFGGDSNILTTVGSSSSAITKLETVTLHEIQTFLQDKDPQKASFICIATVVDVLKDNGWNYISCTGCKTKVSRTETSLFCPKCKQTITVGLLRYRYEITVRDNTGLATFVILDDEGVKIAGRSATEAFHELKEEGNEDPHSTVPDCLYDIVGHTCKFQVSVKEYNFTASRQTITVSRILEYDYEEKEECTGEDSDGDKDEAKEATETENEIAQSKANAGEDKDSGTDQKGPTTRESGVSDANDPAEKRKSKRQRRNN